jgi:two-component system LytT family response regulator
MKPLRAVIVDDELSSRRLLTKLLGLHPEILVVGMARSVPEAVEVCGRLTPDVIFLDVNMPKKPGFELIAHLEHRADVVFVTAHVEHTIKAFDVGSCDYLLKPVSAERLAQSVRRLVTMSRRNTDQEPELSSLSRYDYDATLVLPLGSTIIRVAVGEVALIEADGAYTKITLVSGQTHFFSKGISRWGEILPLKEFMRISRFHLLNIKAVIQLERQSADSSLLVVKGLAEPLSVSRRASVRLRAALKACAFLLE